MTPDALSPADTNRAVTASALAGGGEMGELIRAKDWSNTPLGPVEQWPAGLISTLSICLTARFPMAIYWGQEGYLLYNDAWRPILGEKHPWALGAPAESVWPEIWSIIDPLFASVRDTGEATWRGDELLPMRRFGYTEECYFDYTFNPIRGQSGEVEGILNVVLETTYRVLNDRRAELLRELALRLTLAKSAQEVCEASMAALATDPADLPFALLYLVAPDEQSARLAASTALPASIREASEVIDLSENAAATAWVPGSLAQGRPAWQVHDITQRWGAITAGPWPEPVSQVAVLPVAATGHGGMAALLVAGVSPRRAMDDGYRTFLEHLASQFAAALADARAYEEERKRAEALAELDRAKTTFFSNVSHEFRTPLTLMLGPLEDTLSRRDERLPAEVMEDLSVVHRNGLRLLRLVNSLLDFSRLEAGRVQAAYEPVELAAFTAELASVFRSAIEKAGLRLVVDCPPLEAEVYVDRVMWEKIVLNLLSNAFKFTHEGGITVSLKRDGEKVGLSISDTGIGVPPDEVPRLFERFHRVEGSRGRTHEGTGIGLALVHELVKLHGGNVAIVSEVDRGSTFTVTLPMGMAHLPSHQIRTTSGNSSALQTTNFYADEALRWLPAQDQDFETSQMEDHAEELREGDAHVSATRGARIILADDNADMRNYLHRLLQRYWKVEAVADGEAALDAAQRETPDLVLADVMMPVLDGFGLLKALRTHATLKNLPVILLSARAGEEARVEGMESGADDYLVKPFSARELLARVSAHLQMARLRQESTETLRQSQERVRLATEAAGLGVWVWEPEADRVTWENDRPFEIYGLPRTSEPLTAADFRSRFVHPDDLPAFERATAATLEKGERFYFQGRFRRTDGTIRWIEFTGRLQPAKTDGTPLRMVGTMADITDRKHADEAARRTAEEALAAAQANAKFHTFFDQGTYFAAVMDLEGTVFEANRLCLEYCGFTREEVIGKKFWDCGWWNRSPVLMEMVRTACLQAAAGQTFRKESKYFVADGSERFVDLIIAPVTDEAGRVLYIAPTGTDITERKGLADERESLLRAERAARSEAERVGRMKDEFLATLSHELRTPLNAILGWAYLLKSPDCTPEDIQDGVEVIERNTKVQAQLIEDLLDMSRIISGKVRLDVQRVEIQDTVKAAIESIRHSAEAKDIRLQVVLDPVAGPLRGDPNRLQQCFWNLLSNAIKFTPKKGRIQVSLECVNSHLEVSVTDSGQGIKAEFLPHVFERFRQADASTTRRHGGLGLGLSIVKQLVELHGGVVRAKSAGEGKGATFIIELPLMVVHASESPDREHPRGVSLESLAADHTSLKGLTVLAVDDEPDARELLKRVLEDCGATVLLAGSAEEGMSILKAERPDMILSDIGMPDSDGYEFMRSVRRLKPDEGGRTPAAALTAFARAEDRTKALRAGYQTHVAKPVEPAELTAVVASLSGRSER